MKAIVAAVLLEPHGPTLVRLEAAAGEAVGTWKSASRPPVQGNAYDVEVDVDMVVERGKNLFGSSGALGFDLRGDGTLLVAKVDSVGPDNVACLRMSVDCLVLVEVVGSFAEGETVEIFVPSRSLSFSPFGEEGAAARPR